ncbi:MAG: HAD family hydrolase [Micavibrio sp.]|nr:HAD family hydrolase [Micavibrio sp.]HCK33123.1 HAD family hydrolase [Rhodospirillaceae bacterium]|tara:strand:+ start:712 stop:1446 length:735 start_codon:yes stop_codon:yes gene_type:complete
MIEIAKLSKPTACLFDLDGTIVRHKNQKLIAQLERCDTLIHILTHPFKRSYTLPAEMDLTVNVESNPLVHRLIHGIRIMRGIEVDQVVEPEDDVYAVLDYLKSHNVPMALSSNAYGRSYGKQVLRRYGLREYFTELIFREHVKHGKPSPEVVLRAVHSLGLDKDKPQTIWFVGDQAKDMKAALKAIDQLPENWKLIPFAFRAEDSTAYMYLSRKGRKISGVTKENYITDFRQMLKKLKRVFDLK